MAKPKKSAALSGSDGLSSSDQKVVVLTKDGFDKLVNELEYLKNVKRKEVADRIREAISYGDLSENSEYEDSKNEQAFVEGRIIELEDQVKNVKIIDEKPASRRAASVQLGSRVFVRVLKSKREHEFVIVGSTEADPMKGKISNVSPVGVALLDRFVGDTVSVHSPSGIAEYEICKIE